MRFDINETLLRHVATGGGAAFKLREDTAEEVQGLVAALFEARSDVRRLVRAQSVANAILRVHDFGDIMAVREIVAQQELRRIIGYAKQQDHTAHTVYLYLMGIWFFDNVTALREAVSARSKAKTVADACQWFLYQWMFASLLHDIGYAFFDLSDETILDRKKIDEIYSWRWIEEAFRQGGSSGRVLSATASARLREVYDNWSNKYGQHLPSPTSTYGSNAQAGIVKRLAQVPWIGDLDSKWRNQDAFDVLTLGDGANLRPFAMHVAEHGYSENGNAGYVDHAVASGLLLFQYVSYWYWLLNELRTEQAVFDEVSGGHNYNLENLGDVADACIAVAYHNVHPNVPGARSILDVVTLIEQPVLYLAIACDELQIWDRYPAGDAGLKEFTKTDLDAVEADNIELTCIGADTTKARVRISHIKQADIVKKRQEILSAKLPNYEKDLMPVVEFPASGR